MELRPKWPAEIASNMGAEFCTIPNGLVAYHKFNQGTAYGTNTGVDESPDVSGNNNDGDLNGFALSGTSSNWVPGYPLTTSSVFKHSYFNRMRFTCQSKW